MEEVEHVEGFDVLEGEVKDGVPNKLETSEVFEVLDLDADERREVESVLSEAALDEDLAFERVVLVRVVAVFGIGSRTKAALEAGGNVVNETFSVEIVDDGIELGLMKAGVEKFWLCAIENLVEVLEGKRWVGRHEAEGEILDEEEDFVDIDLDFEIILVHEPSLS